MSWVSVAISTANAWQAGKTAKLQAGVAASQAEYQAQVEQQTALRTAQVIRNAGRRQMGQTTAAYAGAGVVVGEGSAGDVEREVAQNVEIDAFQALLDGGRRARGMQTQAAFDIAGGRMAATAGKVNAIGTALSGSYQAARASGWRTAGPGFSGLQKPAPVEDRSMRAGWDGILKTNRSSGD